MRLSQTAVDDLETAATAHADAEGFWHYVAAYIDSVMGIANLNATELTWLDDAITSQYGKRFRLGIAFAAGLSDNVITGTSAAETLDGTRWNDIIDAKQEADIINGGDGDDILIGNGAHNTNDNDIFRGGAGNDIYRDYVGRR